MVVAAVGLTPAVGTPFTEIGDHLAGTPDLKMLESIVAGDPAKGQLRA